MKRARSLAPDDPFVAFELGMLLINGLNDVSAGLTELEQAFHLGDTYEKITYGRVLIDVLKQHGQTDRADIIKQQQEEFLNEKARAEQSPK